MNNQILITHPAPDEYPEWFAGEIDLVHYPDLITGLNDMQIQTLSLLQNLSEEQLLFRYAEGKWTIKEMWQHVLDVERILSYRALRFARGDKTVLHGFDHDAYAMVSQANQRSWEGMLDEYQDIRRSTIRLFQSFTPEMAMQVGTAGRSVLTARAVGYLVVGHNIHHLETAKERYLKPLT